MLLNLKKKEDPHEQIREYTSLIQDEIYETVSEMFNDQNVMNEINISLKLERWGIIFLLYFDVNEKLNNQNVMNIMLNLFTHVYQNFHILCL